MLTLGSNTADNNRWNRPALINISWIEYCLQDFLNTLCLIVCLRWSDQWRYLGVPPESFHLICTMYIIIRVCSKYLPCHVPLEIYKASNYAKHTIDIGKSWDIRPISSFVILKTVNYSFFPFFLYRIEYSIELC